MRVVCISDTHNKVPNNMKLPEGDLLIHAGDGTMMGSIAEVKQFLEWFSQFDFPCKVLVAGNHDYLFERNPTLVTEMLKEYPDIEYLNDSGTEFDGLKIWGSPVQPWFYDWAFNRARGPEIQKHWDLIPKDTDILVTHGPVYGILDKVWNSWDIAEDRPRKERGYENVGCQNLLEVVREIKPKLHVCGHIHCDRGELEVFGTKFVNASMVNESYAPVYDPIVVTLA